MTELTARPLLSAFYPELAAFVQPLAGEVAAPARALRPAPVRHRLRGRDVDAPARPRPARRHRAGWPRWTSRCATTSHQPLRALGPMAYAVLRVILERLRAEGRLLDDARAPVPDGRRPAGPGRARGAPAVRHAARSRLAGRSRCVYTDLDGTLLGRGASLFRTAEGEFTLLAARALEACHRAGAEVVIKSGRRRAQVMEDARLLGQTLVHLRGRLGPGDRRRADLPDRRAAADARAGRSTRQIEATRARPRCCSSASPACSSPTRPGTSSREVSHLFRGLVDAARGQRAAGAPRATPACGWSTTARSQDSGPRTPTT